MSTFTLTNKAKKIQPRIDKWQSRSGNSDYNAKATIIIGLLTPGLVGGILGSFIAIWAIFVFPFIGMIFAVIFAVILIANDRFEESWRIAEIFLKRAQKTKDKMVALRYILTLKDRTIQTWKQCRKDLGLKNEPTAELDRFPDLIRELAEIEEVCDHKRANADLKKELSDLVIDRMNDALNPIADDVKAGKKAKEEVAMMNQSLELTRQAQEEIAAQNERDAKEAIEKADFEARVNKLRNSRVYVS